MKATPIKLEHKAILSPLLKKLRLTNDLQYVEYSFANIFLYRREHSYKLIETDPPFVLGEFRTGCPYLILTTPPDQIDIKSLKTFDLKNICLFPIPDPWIDQFSSSTKKVMSCRYDSDYLFHVEKLRTLSGRILSSRRNLLHQLQEKYTLESFPLTAKEIPIALRILDAWQESSVQPKEKTDYYACRDSLINMSALELHGRIAYANGEPFGFTVGHFLSPSTVVMHMEKFLKQYKGATAYLYQDFALNLPESVRWINLAQDLGLPALRQGKMAFAPDLLLPKKRVYLTSPEHMEICE